MNTSPSPHDLAGTEKEDEDYPPAAGLVAAAVLRAARRSADLSRQQLAGSLGINDKDILAWEKGTEPVAFLPVTLLDALKTALRTAGAQPDLVADLDAAAWCDLVIDAIAHREDVSCLLADPLAREPAFAELLAWAVAGRMPARYARHAEATPLIGVPDSEPGDGA